MWRKLVDALREIEPTIQILKCIQDQMRKRVIHAERLKRKVELRRS